MSGQVAMWMCLGFVLFGSITAQNITGQNTTSTTMTTSGTTYTATTTLATTAATTLAATTSTAATTLAATTSTSAAAPTTTVATYAATTAAEANSQGTSTVTTSIATAGMTTDAATTATETSSQVTSTVATSIVTVGTTGETQQITVFGKMIMVVPNARSAFVNDPAAKQGIAKSLANIAGVDVNQVSVTLSLGTRRLSARQLQSQSVIVDYTIKVSSASVAAATSLGDQIKGKVKAVPLAELGAQILKNVAAVSTSGTTYTITVTGVTAEAVVEVLVVTNTTSMKQVDGKSGSIRVAGSSWLFVGALGLLLSGSHL
ncbi:unnamed protein product [Polarella glacialis]|uniref:Uncharacterized protein n=1 Tax=Polarella glacialis TaxID=89957 RepID=A0A813IWH6_POLGL|nr:unnamed protein product [Polarella glacialis]